MKRLQKIFLTAVLLSVCFGASAQQKKGIAYRWTTDVIDSRYDAIKDSTATKIIREYDPMLESLYEVVGYTADEYERKRPESGLSNFLTDMIRNYAEHKSGRKVHVAMINFGGIRDVLPKGEVKVYDIFTILPFDNKVVYFDILGSDLIKTFEANVRNPESLSGVKLHIKGDKIVSLEVDGAPIDPDKTYTYATLDFLYSGGDGIRFIGAKNLVEIDEFLRFVACDYFRKVTASLNGEPIVMSGDGRVVIEK